MKYIYYWIILFFFATPFSALHGQGGMGIACSDFIEICRSGWNKIYMASDPGEVAIIIVNENGNFETVDFEPYYEEPYLIFMIEGPIPSSGIYEVIRYDNDNSCWGFFTAIDCQDYLVFPPNSYCGVTFTFKADPTLAAWENEHYEVCQGDTSHIDLSPRSYLSTVTPNELFSIDRLSINNGYVINIQDYSFDIVWDQPGVDSIKLTTSGSIDGLIGNLFTGRTVIIKPSGNMEIIGDNPNDNYQEICAGESVSLTFNNDESSSIKWKISDGRVYRKHQINPIFDTPGTYTIFLEDTDPCHCLEPSYYYVTVLAGESPGIDCTGSVCIGDEVTYYSESECSPYIWSVSSDGTIVDGGGIEDFFITVQWNSGYLGEIGLSTPGCFAISCSEFTSVDIPIISPNGVISGPDVVCFDDFSSFSVPEYNGVNYKWTITYGGYITSGYGTNSVNVSWINFHQPNGMPIDATISVEYDNCILDCIGYAEKTVTILRPLKIENKIYTYCEEGNLMVETNLGDNYDWTLISPSGSETSFSGIHQLTETISDIGVYKIIVTNPNPNTCNPTDSIEVEIISAPISPFDILGPTTVCKNVVSTYTISNIETSESITWEIYDGSLSVVTNTITAKTLNYEWQSNGPYQVIAKKQNSNTGCTSESTTYIFDSLLEIATNDIACIYEEEIYILENYESGDISWQIIPDTAGVLVSSEYNQASILWQHVGDFQLVVEHCAYSKIINIEVVDFDFSIIYDEDICPQEYSQIEILAPIGSSVLVTDVQDNEISASLMDSLLAGEYFIEVTSPDGCTDYQEIEITEYEPFSISISATGALAMCPPQSPVEIIIDSPIPGYLYQWYRDYIPITISGNSSTFSVTDIGFYYLVVTDGKGCTSKSDGLLFYICCGGSSIGNPSILDIDKSDIDCNTKSFTINPPFLSTVINWSFDDPSSGVNNYYTGFTPTHTFTSAGIYKISAFGNEGCDSIMGSVCGQPITSYVCEIGKIIVTIPLAAAFDVVNACVNDSVFFLDQTTKLSSVSGLTYAWDFDDPTSSTNTSILINPFHIYDVAQEYNITLTISDMDGCISEFSKLVDVLPIPDVTFTVPSGGCLGYATNFDVVTSDENLKFSWNFGDIERGKKNKSKLQNPSFIYVKDGDYLVTLTTTNLNGCTSTYSKTISIVINTLSGNISSNINYPKCPETIATLSAPLVGIEYLWNTDETTSEINVSAPGYYSVTITDDSGCEFVPASHFVYNLELFNAVISAKTTQDLYYDSLTICKYQYFILQTDDLPNIKYTWFTSSSTESIIEHYPDLSTLEAGTYSYSVNLEDTVYGCSKTIGPFIVTIVDFPENPTIVADTQDLCENTLVTLSVVDPKDDLTYVWSNGAKGLQMSTYSAGTYSVTASNSTDCGSTSNLIGVRPLPYIYGWMTGCIETCFPLEMCISLYGSYTYNVIKDGEIIETIIGGGTEVEFYGPGDYQLMAVNSSGCEIISETLSLSSSPDDHSLTGIVFIDENENGIFDTGEELLEDIPVTLYSGNTMIDTTLTTDLGFYEFDTVNYANLTAVIDPSGTGYTLFGNLDSILLFNQCIEEKELNFPLLSLCSQYQSDSTYSICPGESVMINGKMYAEFDTDTLHFVIDQDCDSIAIINVLPYTEPQVLTNTVSSCVGMNNGTLHIDNPLGENLTYGLEIDAITSTDTVFYDLGQGEHLLYIENKNGCRYTIPFYITEYETPIVDITPTPSCLSTANGQLDISITLGSDLEFSLSNTDFTPDLMFDNLNAGDYILYIKDANDCDYAQPFTIDQILDPEIDITVNSPCIGLSNGSIDIDIQLGDNLEFSLIEGAGYSDQLSISDLSVDDYILYILDTNGCTYEEPFNIISNPTPIFEIETQDACIDINNGILTINSSSLNNTYSIDTANDFIDTDLFEDLASGNHMLYSQSEFGCVDSLPFVIGQIPSGQVNFGISSACAELTGGTLTIYGSDATNTFAVDNDYFSDSLIYSELPVGDHIFYLKNEKGCVLEIPFKVQETPVPDINMVPNASCENEDNGQLEIEFSQNENLKFAIDADTFISTNYYDQLTSGEHTLSVLNENNCIYSYTFSIEENKLPELEATSENSCVNIDNGTIRVTERTPKTSISINDSPFTLDSIFTDLAAGMYSITIQDTFLCTSISYVEILENQDLVVEVPDLNLDCYTEQLTIIPNVSSHYGELSYRWSDGTEDTQLSTVNNGKLDLIITDECQEVIFNWDLDFSLEVTEDMIYLANIFSPNDDGINDCFITELSPQISLISYTQVIYDRWGNLMFASDDITNCWGGRFMGDHVRPGVFVYMTEITIDQCDGIKTIKKVGDVTVIR